MKPVRLKRLTTKRREFSITRRVLSGSCYRGWQGTVKAVETDRLVSIRAFSSVVPGARLRIIELIRV